MNSTDWYTLSTIVAIFLAPLFAVQVQKWLEGYRDERGRRDWIFKTLMATRAACVSQDHVRALNMIELEFRGRHYKAVVADWRVYRDHLGSYPRDGGEQAVVVWSEKLKDLMARLLKQMGETLGYDFDEVDIKKGCYTPEAHGALESEQTMLRRGLVDLLYGNKALKLDLARDGTDREVTDFDASRGVLLDLIRSDKPLVIRIGEAHDQQGGRALS